MIKNKAAKALIISACLTFSSMAGVYADTNEVEVKPAIVQEAADESEVMTIQIQSAIDESPLAQKQREIDLYVFEQHKDEIEKLGTNILSTGVIGDVVEIAIEPYTVEAAEGLYKIFGKDMVKVVEAEANVPLEYVTMSAPQEAQEEASFFGKIFNSIVEWFKSIF